MESIAWVIAIALGFVAGLYIGRRNKHRGSSTGGSKGGTDRVDP